MERKEQFNMLRDRERRSTPICECDLEGIVCERKSSVYSKYGRAWLKVKNRNYTQAKDRQELFNPSRERPRKAVR